GHGRSGEHRIQQPEGRNRDGGAVVAEGPEQILLDRAQRAPREPDRIRGRPQVTADQGDISGFDGHVGAGAHRQAEVGLGQGGGVVDTVADLGHDLAFALEEGDEVDLVIRHHFGYALVYAVIAGALLDTGLVV